MRKIKELWAALNIGDHEIDDVFVGALSAAAALALVCFALTIFGHGYGFLAFGVVFVVVLAVGLVGRYLIEKDKI